MKTKEAILDSKWAHWRDFSADHPASSGHIIDAMQTYADQETAQLKQEVADQKQTISDLRRRLDDCERKRMERI